MDGTQIDKTQDNGMTAPLSSVTTPVQGGSIRESTDRQAIGAAGQKKAQSRYSLRPGRHPPDRLV